MNCSVAEVMEAIGDRWGLMIMRDLLLGLSRYNDLQTSSGATNATLSDRLKRLEETGLVERRLYQTRPDRYEYLPSKRGQDIVLLIQAMIQIGDRWRLQEKRKIPLRFVDGDSGFTLALVAVDAAKKVAKDQPTLAIEVGPGADDLMRWRVTQGREQRIARAAAAGRRRQQLRAP